MRLDIFEYKKKHGIPFAGISLYDAAMAKCAEAAQIDYLLVGDSLGQNVCGYNSTVPVTMEQMCAHTRYVRQGAPNTYIMSDLPYMQYCLSAQALENATKIMQAGADMVKLECLPATVPIVETLSQSGFSVCAHIGLTPQMVHQIGGYRYQGKTPEAATALIQLARSLEEAGAAVLLLECVISSVVTDLMAAISIPVIGIGAGVQTDGQVLVVTDMLGLTGKKIRFSHNFLEENTNIETAFSAYLQAVQQRRFPSDEHTYS